VASRVKLRAPNSSELAKLEIMMIDPRSTYARDHAITERRRRGDHMNMTAEEVLEEIRDDIFMSLVALFDIRSAAREIVIGHDQGAILDRTELFDDAAYDARIAVPGAEAFPRTGRWLSRQPSYERLAERLRNDMARVPHIKFNAWSDEALLTAHLTELEMDTARIEEMRIRYAARYVDQLEPVVTTARSFVEAYQSEPAVQ
jgi:hypothetical protein